MDQAEFELKLKVWKDLALSKQMLINSATESLGLDEDCGMDEFKEALTAAIDRANKADHLVAETNETTSTALAEMEARVEVTEKAIKKAETERDAAISARDSSEQSMVAAKEANSDAIKKATREAQEKSREIKSIHQALADTPENVLKKIKRLNKEKHDENVERKRAEGEIRNLKKDKKKLDMEIAEQKAKLEQAAELVTAHRELHTLASEQYTQLTPLVADDVELTEVPELNEDQLNLLSPPVEDEEDNDDAKDAKKK